MKFIKHWVIFTLILASSSTLFAGSDNEIHITGTGSVKIIADTSFISLSVTLQENELDTLMSSLSHKVNSVLETLRKFHPSMLETYQIQIHPQYDYKNNNQLIGYQGYQKVSFQSPSDISGKMIAEAMNAGANRIDSVQLIPKETQLKQAQIEALKLASLDAQEKAEAVLKCLHLKKEEIVEIEVLDASHPPKHYPRLMGAHTKHAAQMEILPETQEVEKHVRLTLSFK